MARVFISYASEDLARALELSSWLADSGHDVFVDQDPSRGLTVGEDWERQLRDHLRWSDAVVCLITAAYSRSVWCSTEALFARWLGNVVVPILAEPGAEHPLLRFPVQYADLTADLTLARARLIEAIRRTDHLSTSWSHRDSPYPGLRAFDAGLRSVFFGRTAETADLARAVRSPVAPGCLLVIGPSGCGKSSLVRAGLVPVIAAEPGWLALQPFTPGTDPESALVRELVSTARHRGLSWSVADVRAGRPADLVAELLIGRPGRRQERLLVVIDQLEEVLTQTPLDRKASFAQSLLALTDGPVQLVATVRSEFVDRVLADPDLHPLAGATFPVRPLAQAQLRSVVEGPARLAGITVSEDLLQRLVADTDDGSALPLLAFTLAQLVHDRAGSELSSARYDELGGVRGAMVKHADNALAEATATTSRTPDEVITGLLELVTVDDHDQPVRGRALRSALPRPVAQEMDVFIAHRLLTAEDDGAITVAHEAFLTTWRPMAGAITAEATALRARGAIERAATSWDSAGRPAVRLWEGNQLAAAVADVGAQVRPAGLWRRDTGVIRTSRVELKECSRSFLLAGLRRDRVRRGRLTTVLSALLVVALVAAGVAFVKQREAERQQRISASRALVSRAEATIRDDPQLAFMLGVAAHELDPGLDTRNSLIESLTSTHYGGTMTGHTGEVLAVGFAQDKRTLATAGADHTVILFDLADPTRSRELTRLTEHRAEVADLAFSPVAPVLATADRDGQVILWDVGDPSRTAQIGRLSSDNSSVHTIAISPDGRTLAAGGMDIDKRSGEMLGGGVWLWDIGEPAAPRKIGRLSGQEPWVSGLAFHPDGRTLASVSEDGTLVLWDTSDPARASALTSLPRDPSTAWSSVAFSPDGRTLASVGAGMSSAVLWDVTDRTKASRIGTPPIGVGSNLHEVVFSPDGATLVAANQDRSLVRWDVRRPAEPLALPSFQGHARGVEAVAFHPDGTYLVTGGQDKKAALWHVRNPAGALRHGEPLTGHAGEVEHLEFRADGQLLVSSSAEGTITFWDTRDRARPTIVHRLAPGHREELSALAFSPDGRLLATGSHDGAVMLWDVSDPAAPFRVDQPVSDREGRVVDLAFGPDGGQLLICGLDGRVSLWDLAGRARTDVPGETPRLVHTAAFGRDGTVLALGGPGPGTWLWDVSDPRRPRAIDTQTGERAGYVMESAFAGGVLATSTADLTVVLWDLSDPTRPLRIGQPLTGHDTLVVKMAFSADRQTLLTVDHDRAAILWNVSAPDHPRRIGSQLSAEGTTAFSPDGRTVALAKGDAVMLWDLSTLADARDHPVERACERAGRGLSRDEWNHYAGPQYRETCRSPGR